MKRINISEETLKSVTRRMLKFLVIALLLNVGVIASRSMAESTRVILYTNESKAVSAPLDNDANGYLYTVGVASTSRYQVKANYGTSSHERTKGFVQPGDTKTWSITQKEYPYNNARVILYGYSQAEPRKHCYATGILAKR